MSLLKPFAYIYKFVENYSVYVQLSYESFCIINETKTKK